jgi:hypothetical protein
MKLHQPTLIANLPRFKHQQGVEKIKKHSFNPHFHTLNLARSSFPFDNAG